ncbi:hypothetical protein PENSPDRAFT_751434 [Peniophora sp. CONT]|nr:hypothetical protein PENSPDRAFT_751434 [Peniophora sp. CONT]
MDRLSNEVLEHQLSYLECVDIDSCRLACRRLRAVIHGSILLRYLYRLQRSGRIDPNIHSSKLSISRRLHALQDHENAWLRADFTPVSTVRLPMNANAIAEIVSMHESIYLLSQLDNDHQFAYGKLMRLHDASVTDAGGSWQELDLTGQPASTDMRVVRDVKFLEECNLILVSSVEGTGHRVNRLIFDFYSADTFEPHPDAARPSVILNCPDSLQLIVEGGDLLSNSVATVTLSGDFVLFNVVDWTSERIVDGRSLVKDHLFYCILWRRGLLIPVGTQSSWAACIEMQFIAQNTILITHADEKPHLELCTLAECPERGWVLQTALCLELPQFAPRVTLSTCSGILTDDTGTTGLVAHPTSSPPLFSTSMSTSMCILSITLERVAARALFFHSFILVMRCASLLKLFTEVPLEDRTTWSQLTESYLYMDGEIPGPMDTDAQPRLTARPLPRTMNAERWSKEGVLWIDGGEMDETLGVYDWSVHGQHLLAWAEEFDYSGPALPLRVFHFNEHDIERALSLVRSISVQLPEGVTPTKDPSSSSTGYEDPDADAEPPNSFFGQWTNISNGKKIAVVEQPPSTPAGVWWSHDLVSNLPFAITQTTQAERWPMITIHGDLIMRKKQSQAVDGIGHEANTEPGTCFEVFRIGSGGTVE